MLQSVRPGAHAPVATTETRSIAGRPRTAFRAGVEAMVPFILGLSPVALIVGATIGEHEARWAAWMGVWPIFSGNAHVATGAGAARRRRRRRHPDRAGRQHPRRGLRLRRGGALAAPTPLVPAPGALPPGRSRRSRPASTTPPTTPTRRSNAGSSSPPGSPSASRSGRWSRSGCSWAAGSTVVSGSTSPCRCAWSSRSGRGCGPGRRAVAATLGALVIVISAGWPSGTGMLVAIAAGAVGGLVAEGGRRP